MVSFYSRDIQVAVSNPRPEIRSYSSYAPSQQSHTYSPAPAPSTHSRVYRESPASRPSPASHPHPTYKPLASKASEEFKAAWTDSG
jgi:hypothetical protein